MRRVISLLAVAAIMALVMVLSAVAAFAVGQGTAGPQTGANVSGCAQQEAGPHSAAGGCRLGTPAADRPAGGQ